LHWPAELRSAFDALFDIDDALSGVVVGSTQPALGAIKLAWWRDALERLDGGPPAGEPRLQAVASELLPRGISGGEVAALAPGWATLLDEQPDPGLVGQRGVTLFNLAGHLLGAPPAGVAGAGALYAMVQVARRQNDAGWLDQAAASGLGRSPRKARPLTALAALAARDVRRKRGQGWEPEATPGRSLTILRHRLTGAL
jgi:phytoene synthase